MAGTSMWHTSRLVWGRGGRVGGGRVVLEVWKVRGITRQCGAPDAGSGSKRGKGKGREEGVVL